MTLETILLNRSVKGGTPCPLGNPEAQAVKEAAATEGSIKEKGRLTAELQGMTDWQGLNQSEQNDILDEIYKVPLPAEAIAAFAAVSGNEEAQNRFDEMMDKKITKGNVVDNVKGVLAEVETDIADGKGGDEAEEIIANQGKNRILAKYRADLNRATDRQAVERIKREARAQLNGTLIESFTGVIDGIADARGLQLQQEANLGAINRGEYGGSFGQPLGEVTDIVDIQFMYTDAGSAAGMGELSTEQVVGLQENIQAKGLQIMEARLAQIDTDGDLTELLNFGSAISGVVSGLSLAGEMELRNRRQELIDRARDQIQGEIDTAWEGIANNPNYPTAELRARAMSPVLAQLNSKYGATALGGLGINLGSMAGEAAKHDIDSLSENINAQVAANPNITADQYIAALTPDDIANFGGEDAIRNIFERNTDTDQRAQHIASVAAAGVRNGMTKAEVHRMLKDAGFNGPDFFKQADRAFAVEQDRVIRQNTETAISVLHEAFNWNDLSFEGQTDWLTNKQKEIRDALRAKGMSDAEINRAIARLNRRNVFQKDLLDSTEDNVQDEKFSNIRTSIDDDDTLTDNQKDALKAKMDLAEASIRSHTSLFEKIAKGVGFTQEQLDSARNRLMNARTFWVGIKYASPMVLLVLAGLAGGPAGFAILSGNMALLSGLSGIAWGGLKANSWWKEQAQVREANTAVRAAMADRRVAGDEMNEMLREALGALNYLRDHPGLTMDQLKPHQREVFERLGIMRGERVDAEAIVGRLAQAGTNYRQSVDKLSGEFTKRKDKIRSINDRGKLHKTAQSPLYPNMPSALMAA